MEANPASGVPQLVDTDVGTDRIRSDAPMTCPECGGRLEIDPACTIEELVFPRHTLRRYTIDDFPRRQRIAPAALCSSCEFCAELEDLPHAPK